MLSVQCGWVLSCLVVALLHQRAHPAATTSSPNNESPLPPPQQQQQQQKSTDHTGKPDAETEAGVTCYTCVNVSDNLVCNRFAIDRPCPQGEEFCHTLHIMDSHGESVIVNKKCADQYECSPQRIGCLDIDSQKVCVSCCDEMYCNVAVPTNHSNAVLSDARTRARHQKQNLPDKKSPASNRSTRLQGLPALLATFLAVASI